MSQKKITYLSRSLSKDEEIKSIAELHWINWVWVVIFTILTFWMIITIPFIIIKILDLKKREMICTTKRVLTNRTYVTFFNKKINLNLI